MNAPKITLTLILLLSALGCATDTEASSGGAMDSGETFDTSDLAPFEFPGGGDSSGAGHGATGWATGSSEDDGSTTVVDDSEGSSDGTGSSGGDESTTGAESPGPYGDCYEGEQKGFPDCAEACVQAVEVSACAPACVEYCPDGPDGFEAECIDADNLSGVCVIPCDPGCPTGMLCSETEFVQAGVPVWLCLWP